MDSDGGCGVERTEAAPALDNTFSFQGSCTPDLALLDGAVTIDAGMNIDGPATDQRGATRPADGDGDQTETCDDGAFEFSHAIFANRFESSARRAETTPS